MKSFSVTDVGLKRTVNQDSVYCDEQAIGRFANLFIVADGMGGHNAGDYASKLCVGTIVESIRNSDKKTPVSILEEAIRRANDKIGEEASHDAGLQGMGTTLVMASILDGTLYVANIGDSRLYLISGAEGLRQVTEDHSYVEEMVKSGKIPKEDANHHPNKNVITRAIGIVPDVMADYFELDVGEGDKVLLCSDGLTNMLDDEEIGRIIEENGDDPEKAAIYLKDRANENGGKDNISVILVTI